MSGSVYSWWLQITAVTKNCMVATMSTSVRSTLVLKMDYATAANCG